MTIAEVSRKMDISADTLRYYERIGLIPPVKRSKSGIRDYSEKDLGWISFAKCMRGAGDFHRSADRICRPVPAGGRHDHHQKADPHRPER